MDTTDMNTHLEYLKQFRSGAMTTQIPTQEELLDHLRRRVNLVGETAFAEFYHLQRIAAECWGAAETSHFAVVLRQQRGSHGAAPSTAWQRARKSIARLPDEWRVSFDAVADASQLKTDRRARLIWSADHLKAVADALVRWHSYCTEGRVSKMPTAVSLDDYAAALIGDHARPCPITLRSASDYLKRIYSGYINVVSPGFASAACEFVVRDWDERAKSVGATTKCGAQLVGARALYDLGFEKMNAACNSPILSLHAATLFRNGLILSFGISLPQRARALSALDLGRSLQLLDDGRIFVRLSAENLKMLERKKRGETFEWTFLNPRLHAALSRYERDFRPIFDSGTCLFPSRKVIGAPISEKQIGLLAGNMTEAAFGVRIPIHRLRDNVATDASEYMVGGPGTAASLLGHRDQATTARHYDHAEGVTATRAFSEAIESRKTMLVDLKL